MRENILPARRVLLVLGIWIVSGCSGPAASTVDEEPEEERLVPLSSVETFDAATHGDLPEPEPPPVRHDVPEALMSSSADDGIVEEVRGYRVQVFSSAEQDASVQVEDELRRWADSLDEDRLAELGISADINVYTIFRAPYYRVRIGDFKDRAKAEPVAAALAALFESVLIVPDMIVIRR